MESEGRRKVQAGGTNLAAMGTEGPLEVLDQLAELF